MILNTLAVIAAFLAAEKNNTLKLAELPPLPEPVSSFGGAVADGWLYVYSGHIGTAHQHSADNLSTAFRRLHLTNPEGWEELPTGQPLQGVPLVAHNGLLYRVGGLSAKNKKGDPAELESVASVQCYDPKKQTWTDLPDLPQGRSSHDAVVSGDHIFVVGGWTLGKDQEEWCTTALVLNLADPASGWKKVAAPPFERRALAIAAARNKIYAMGGMNSENTPIGDVTVYDIQSDTWKEGPHVPGDGRLAFGMSAWGDGDEVYATKLDGTVFRLNAEGDGWDILGKLPVGRFFHRLLPAAPGELLVVAGANMQQGHLATVGKLRVR